ncbi:hypothetical protein ACGYU5_15310 [Burkholderia pseudomallei]
MIEAYTRHPAFDTLEVPLRSYRPDLYAWVVDDAIIFREHVQRAEVCTRLNLEEMKRESFYRLTGYSGGAQ